MVPRSHAAAGHFSKLLNRLVQKYAPPGTHSSRTLGVPLASGLDQVTSKEAEVHTNFASTDAGLCQELRSFQRRWKYALPGTGQPFHSSAETCFRTSPAGPSSDQIKQDAGGRPVLGRVSGASFGLNRGFGALAASVYEDPIETPDSDSDDTSSDLRLDSKAEIETIAAQLKFETGKIAAKKDRKALRVPGVVYSLKDGHLGGNKVSVTVLAKDINRVLRRYGHSFVLSRQFTLEITSDVDGVQTVTREAVLPRAIDYAPARDDVVNITFIRLLPGERIKVNVPLVFMGADGSPGIRRGGYLNTIKRTVRYLCPSDKIPTHIEVDLSKLDMGDKILLGDLMVDPEVTLVKQDPSWPVCKIMGNKGSGP